MKRLFTGFLLFMCLGCFSQTVKELEHELSFYKANEKWGQKKDVALKLLKIDFKNKNAIRYIVELYNQKNQKDSINLFFDKLIKENPESPELYLLRADMRISDCAGLSIDQRINYLEMAYKLGSSNAETINTIGRFYYDLFVREFATNKNTVKLNNYSTNAIKYFSQLFDQSNYNKESLKFPLLQLANYSGDNIKKTFYQNYKVQSSHFPLLALADLPNDWATNYSVNVFDYVSQSENKVSGIQSAIFRNNWYSRHLKALEETVLSDSLPKTVYRFTWLRTFHNPVAIRMEKNDDSVKLYWKVTDGQGGYNPGKIVVNKSKTLTLNEWQDFETAIKSIDFWKLPTTERTFGLDGAQWILEGVADGRYHVVDRWSGGKIKDLCLKLLKLTDIEIKQSDIY